MKNNILHCGICGNVLNINISTLETQPLKPNYSTEFIETGYGFILPDLYTYVKLFCYCQYHNKQIFEYYLTAPEWYLLIKMIKKPKKKIRRIDVIDL